MLRPSKQMLIWAPRVLCVLFATFLSLFALDVFSEVSGFWRTLGALAMHLIPTGLVLVALAVAWRREGIGGMLFIALGLLYVIVSRGRLHWSAYAVIGGPLILLGILFLANSYRSGRQKIAGPSV
jgi:glucose-6-phosphate-specific signal transduction histidine kinase